MKKSFVIISAVAPIAVLTAGLCVSFNNGGLRPLRADNDKNEYELTFTADDSDHESYDTVNWVYPFSLAKTDVFFDEYDISTVDFFNLEYEYYGTYIYATENNVTFGNGNILTIKECEVYEEINIAFELIKRASIDLDNSYVEYYINGYRSVKNFALSDEGSTYNEYSTYLAFTTKYYNYNVINEAKIDIRSVHLKFSCAK